MGQLTKFRQSTGYSETYSYDKAGNMTAKVISGTDGQQVSLKMRYNDANQLTVMQKDNEKNTYRYDKNGSMVKKTLKSRLYGTLTDDYRYNAQDMMTGYEGYDGYKQEFTYSANGIRLTKSESGNAERSTLEELLRGNIAGLPDVVEPVQDGNTSADESVPEEYAWATTEYLYDLTQEYYQVISETTTSTGGTSVTTAYAYGLERIAAYGTNADGEAYRTGYIYDGRGSVAQTVTIPTAGQTTSSAITNVQVTVQSFAYTAYGEQMGAVKVSGFTYNAEAYDTATGMLNLRARQYEPAMNRFSQKDIVRGQTVSPLSLNRYAYCENSPVIHIDPSGMVVKPLLSKVKSIVTTAVKTASNAINSVVSSLLTKQNENIINSSTVLKQAVKNEKSVKDNRSASDVISTLGKCFAACGASLLSKNTNKDKKKASVLNTLSNILIPSAKAEDLLPTLSYAKTWINAYSPYMMDIQNLDGTYPVADAAAFIGLIGIGTAGLIADGVKRLIESFPVANHGESNIEVLPQQLQPPMTESFPTGKMQSISINEGIDIVPQPGPAPDIFVTTTPMPTIVYSKEHKVGENGTQTTSTTVGKGQNKERVDVENPAPGDRDGDLHYHDSNGNKWRIDWENKSLMNPENNTPAPTSVQKIWNEEWFIKAVEKGLRYLGE